MAIKDAAEIIPVDLANVIGNNTFTLFKDAEFFLSLVVQAFNSGAWDAEFKSWSP